MGVLHGLEDPISGDVPDHGRAVQNPGDGGHGNVRFPGHIVDCGSVMEVHSKNRANSASVFIAASKTARSLYLAFTFYETGYILFSLFQPCQGEKGGAPEKRGDGKISRRLFSSALSLSSLPDGSLYLFYGDGTGGAYFDATLAAQTFIHVHRFGFPVLHLKHAGRAGVYAFTLAVAFILVHGYLIHSFLFTSLYGFKAFFSSVMLSLF